MMPHNHIHMKCTGGRLWKSYHLWMISKYQPKIKELKTLTQMIQIYKQNIGIEFGIEKCTMLIIKKGKREIAERIEQPNKKSIKTLIEKENYLWIFETDNINQMKEKVRKEKLKRTRKLLKTKVCSKKVIKGINTRAIPLARYSAPYLKWIRRPSEK